MMGRNSFILCCVFFLFISCVTIKHCEGRRLYIAKEKSCLECLMPGERVGVETKRDVGDLTQRRGLVDSDNVDLDKARPTTPGNSPGVGHSIGN